MVSHMGCRHQNLLVNLRTLLPHLQSAHTLLHSIKAYTLLSIDQNMLPISISPMPTSEGQLHALCTLHIYLRTAAEVATSDQRLTAVVAAWAAVLTGVGTKLFAAPVPVSLA